MLTPDLEKDIRDTNQLRKIKPIVSSASYDLAIKDIDTLLLELDRLRECYRNSMQDTHDVIREKEKLLAEIDRLRTEYRLPEQGFHRTLQNRIDSLEEKLAIAIRLLEKYAHSMSLSEREDFSKIQGENLEPQKEPAHDQEKHRSKSFRQTGFISGCPRCEWLSRLPERQKV
jgi:hypothetical protein